MTVTQKQLILAYFGFLMPSQVDGIWGSQSEEATKQLQRKLDLEDDGVFGEITKTEALYAMSNGIEVQEPSPEPVTGTWWDEIDYFEKEEFRCTCGGRGCTGYPVDPSERLVRNLDDIRKHFGRVVNITSGVRCQLRNSELPGSASNSLHMRGKASDFGVDGVYASTVLEYAWTLPDVDEAYAIDDFHVHIGVLKYS